MPVNAGWVSPGDPASTVASAVSDVVGADVAAATSVVVADPAGSVAGAGDAGGIVTSPGGSTMLSGPSTASLSSMSRASSIEALDCSVADGHGPGSAMPATIETASGVAPVVSGSTSSTNVIAEATIAPSTKRSRDSG